MVRLHKAGYRYNPGTPMEREALGDITLEIAAGETVGIIGPPASGKTTLARLLAGLLPPTVGSAVTPGLGPGKGGIAFQFAEDQLFCPTVFEDITYALREILALPAGEVEEKYREACRRMGLDPEEMRDRRQFDLSGGERRRVAIAGILAMDPCLIVLDEPTVGLDHPTRKVLLAEIARLAGLGKAVVVVSHDLETLLGVSKRIIRLAGGRIVDDGPPREVLARCAAGEDGSPLIPPVTEVMVELRRRGRDVRTDIFTADEAMKEFGLGGGRSGR